jgi:hypothetical protein
VRSDDTCWPEVSAIGFAVLAALFGMYPLYIAAILLAAVVVESWNTIATILRYSNVTISASMATAATVCAYTSYRALDQRPSAWWTWASCISTVALITIALIIRPNFFSCFTYC